MLGLQELSCVFAGKALIMAVTFGVPNTTQYIPNFPVPVSNTACEGA